MQNDIDSVDYPVRKIYRTMDEAFPGSSKYAEYIEYPEPSLFGNRVVKAMAVITVIYIVVMIVRSYV